MPKRATDTTLPSREGFSVSGSGASAWSLTILHSPVRGLVSRRFDLGARLCIGRVERAGIDVAIDDAKLSRDHAMITRAGVIVEIRDQDSRNGTFVNGTRVSAGMLQPGDIVRVGDTLLELGDAPARDSCGEPTLLGTAPAFLAAVELADRVASSDLPVILLGETGTGKDLLAQHIHERSGRRGPMIAVNCAALADDLIESTLFGHRKGAFTGATSDSLGLFLEAQGGTLFLDEIGELGFAHQAKLLRALDAREIIPVGGTRCVHTDARVIAATNIELAARVADGGFRADLYARLAGAVIRMPPLRARRGDILGLAGRFLAQSTPAVERRLSGQAAERLLLHPWPRNIRELVSAMRRLALQLGDRAEVRRADVDAVLEAPLVATSEASRQLATDGVPGMPTREELTTQLAALHGNIIRLATCYGKDAKQIYRWLKRYQLDPRDYR
ncbi:MAG TPA: sigma 54-interacting transcriptional regulator [Kofleriaceae bacterium]|nr:sigma 54-interacting transcriptional regulator [Kofleriaceae bacterium]